MRHLPLANFVIGLIGLFVTIVALVLTAVQTGLAIRDDRPAPPAVQQRSLDVSAGHGLDDAQQGGIQRPGGTMDDRP